MTRHPGTEGNDLRPATVDVSEPDGLRLQGTPVGNDFSGFPVVIDGDRSVTIAPNHQQLVAGEMKITDGSLTFGDGAELRVI